MKRKIHVYKTAVIFWISAVFLFSPIACPYSPSGNSWDSLPGIIDGYVEEHLGKEVPGVAVALVRNGEIIFLKGYGYGNLEMQTPVDPRETVFEYGSINKLFVWVSVMQLYEAGLLDLREDIRSYLPEDMVTGLRMEHPVTLLDLMHHTAGFEDPMFNFAIKNPGKMGSFSESLLRFQPVQKFIPGTVSAYSNHGTALAAYVVKSISSSNYSDFQQAHIFVPSGMEKISGHPLFEDNPGVLEQKATGYTLKKDSFHEAPWIFVPKYPAGIANGTVEELARFALALTPEVPVDSPLFLYGETLETLFTRSYGEGELLTGNAHGFWEYPGAVTTLGHSGNTAGFSGLLAIYPEERTALAVLTNRAEANDFLYGLHTLVFGTVPPGVLTDEVFRSNAYEVAGSYLSSRSAYGNFLELFSHLNVLRVEALGERQLRLTLPGYEAIYVQTGENRYHISEGSAPLVKYHFTELIFEKEGEKVLRAITGSGVDLLPLDFFHSKIFIYYSAISLGISSVLLLVFPVITFLWVRRLPGPSGYYFLLLCLTGALLVVNNLVLVYRGLGMLYMYAGSLQWHILGNQVLFFFLLFFTGMMAGKLHKEKWARERIQFMVLPSLFLLNFVFLLWHWNFFVRIM